MRDSTADTREDAVRIRGVQDHEAGPFPKFIFWRTKRRYGRLCWAPTISKPRGQRSLSLVSLDSGQALRTFERSSTTRGIRGNPASAPTAKVSSTLSVKREWTICGCNRWTAAPADS